LKKIIIIILSVYALLNIMIINKAYSYHCVDDCFESIPVPEKNCYTGIINDGNDAFWNNPPFNGNFCKDNDPWGVGKRIFLFSHCGGGLCVGDTNTQTTGGNQVCLDYSGFDRGELCAVAHYPQGTQSYHCPDCINRYYYCYCLYTQSCAACGGCLSCGQCEYFDTSQCACVDMESKVDCKGGSQWNNDKCTCECPATCPGGGVPSYPDCECACSAPQGGCATDYEWNEETCLCEQFASSREKRGMKNRSYKKEGIRSIGRGAFEERWFE
jgi:hypothetical protein